MRQPCDLYINGELLRELTIPAEVEAIPAYAFQYVNLDTVTFSHRIKTAGNYAFYCSSVTTVSMVDSLTNVGTNAFANCASLSKVYFAGDQSKWSTIAWNSGNDSLIDAERIYVSSLDDDLHRVTVAAAEHGTITVSDSYCLPGDVITVTARPEPGYQLARILVNDVALEGNQFTAESGVDYNVTAEFSFYREVLDYGTCGDGVEWCLYGNNELVIRGNGAMKNYESYYNSNFAHCKS